MGPPCAKEEDWPNTRTLWDPRVPERKLPRPDLLSLRKKVAETLSGPKIFWKRRQANSCGPL